ncbi:MAG TPA: FtsX-like permease family protein [Xanthobacteraceae bacterium]|nr:FtsX-like permease family protein [Xanthobacteraceae bacterium]
MLAPAPQSTPLHRWRFAGRFIWRDLRGGLRGFGVFIGCIALGVMAIAGVGSVAASLNDGIAGAGQAILGGDISFTLIQRQANDAERAFFDARGDVSVVATLRAMARTADGRSTLVELKAVDRHYPLFGVAVTDPAMPLDALLAEKNGAFGAAVDPALLARLDLKTGDRISIGGATIELRAALTSEPDKLASGIGFGPRVLIGEAALQASGLVQPGSLIRWQYRLRLPPRDASDAAIARVEKQAQTEFPQAGWEIRSRRNAAPALERSVERFSQFLTLVGLTTLLIGGVGVANAVANYLARKRDAIATMKALGLTGGGVFAVYCGEILLVALIAAAIGAAAGAALPFVLARAFGTIIPLPVEPALHPPILALALAYGLLTALAFALWPLGSAHDIPVSVLFRDRVSAERTRPPLRYIVAAASIVALVAVLSILTTYDRRVAVFFVIAAAAVFLALRLLARAVMWIAQHLPRPRSTTLRLAIANMHRPGALTPSVMLSLGLGLALLVTVVELDANLHRELAEALPAQAPSFFFLDIAAADADRFDAFVHRQDPGATLEQVPMLRGRIVAANGVPADELKPAAGSRWVLRGDRGITYAAAVPAGSRIVAGQWWSADYSGTPLVSLESRTAQNLNLKIGDTVTVNVLGRNVTARIANLRSVDWENLGINFVLVYSPGAFAGAPHTDIATLTFADGGSAGEDAALIKALAQAFPTVTALRVKDALNAVEDMVAKLILAVRGASLITLVAAALVLGGALAASQQFRIYDAVVLKTLGATRARLMAAYALEYFLIGLATALFGVGAGAVAAALVVTRLMEFSFVFVPGVAAGTAILALFVTVALGLAGTVSALGRKPAEVLRNL